MTTMTTETIPAVGPFLVFTEGEFSRVLNTEQECRDFASHADDVTAGNVRVTWVPVRVAEAAPDLLAALRDLLETNDANRQYVHGHPGAMFAFAAIDKAIGGTA